MTLYKEIASHLPVEKNKKDSLLVRFVVRPVSTFLAIPFVKSGTRANTISYVSLGIAVAAITLLTYSYLIGGLLLFLWIVFDCIDGNIARYTGTSNPFGGLIDSTSSFLIHLSIIPAMGYGVIGSNSSETVILGASIISTVFVGLSNIIYQKFMNTVAGVSREETLNKKYEAATQEKTKSSVERLLHRIRKELGISGLLIPVLIISPFLEVEFEVWAFFCGLYGVQGLLAFILILFWSERKSRNTV